ncbi:MAG TPA: bifunctional diguanylate cyclase/phosphodiesterase, partial [Solirubrobacteraceae bacterium]
GARSDPSPGRMLGIHLRAVAAGGSGVLALLAAEGGIGRVADLPLLFVLLAGCVVLGEALPVTVPGHDEEVTTSTAFTFALLMIFGLAPAAICQAVASALCDAVRRKPLLVAVFNIGQCTLALAAAAAVLHAFGAPATPAAALHLTPGDLLALAASGTAFFAVNNLLAGVALALSQRAAIRGVLLDDLAFQAGTAGLLLGFAPLVVAAASAGTFLVPLLSLPLYAIFRGGRDAQLSEHHALHDRLTDLPNRVLFRDRAERAIAAARRGGRTVAVLIMDLDSFKEVNDTLGHHHGDLLLREIGPRLAARLRASDTVARMGGDEFAILLPDVRGADEACEVARAVLEQLGRPLTIGGVTLDVRASIGVACFPDHGDDVDVLLQRADVAMYNAKSARAGAAVYDLNQDPYSVERLVLAAQLREAIERREIVLHYQPQVDLATGRCSGVEALARWEHPERGNLPPDTFIPLAEQTGQIRALTMCVIQQAVAQCARWQAGGLDLDVAVNVSARDLLDLDLPATVDDLLRSHGLPADRLVLEITESMLVADPHRAERVLRQLSRLGVRIAVDDFGTGYSSLTYLKRMPIDEIKVDRSFVLNMATNADDAAIVASTVGLGQNLGLRTVAEGVENAAAFAVLQGMGCDRAQGYHLSRPVPAPELEAWAARAAGGELLADPPAALLAS